MAAPGGTSEAHDPQPIHLYQQRFKLHAWIRSRLWAQVMVGMALGFAVGTILSPDIGILDAATAELLGAWLALPGQIFLGLIAMVLVPLIFASIVGGLNGAQSGAELRSTGLRLAGFILATTFAAAWIGVALARWLQPGASVHGLSMSGSAAVPEAGESPFDGAQAPDIIAGILPTNPTASIVQGDLLAVVVLAVLVGIAATQVNRDKVAPFLALLDALLAIAMTIVKWAMFLAPIAVFGLMAQLVMRVGLETVAAMSTYVGTVFLGLALLLVIYLAIAALVAKVTPMRFLKTAGGTLLLAFSTSSSSAVMPMTIQTARRLGVPDATANLVVPLGATMNMAGTALYQSVAILFLAQMAGIELSLGEIAIITATLVASSIGAPGTPGVSIAILLSVAAGFGIPTAGMVIILGVDRILDMSRTAVNVTGDLVASMVLSGRKVRDADGSSPAEP
ncbi:cation:dicarboxylase symporter family transporter [Chelativorans sp. ZYF759]|uniref:dicarboxylate/amino acid:cation symporter n=1 Tax=Chelativorans sp. ZYF759 TaxID=2692213 RepID=UPI00145C980F|nr:dicarboxylate/amino acid:cation symporter [Chelativorans sp. ZYF759]NMG40644.1 cation:dicarboxylase symporter family transporter [Chelativorans sp. ZYF759]